MMVEVKICYQQEENQCDGVVQEEGQDDVEDCRDGREDGAECWGR